MPLVSLPLTFRLDDLSGTPTRSLIARHLAGMHASSPPDSVHALDVEALRAPNVTFWSAWIGDEIAGCGALKRLDDARGEIKSMRVDDAYLGRGVGRALLNFLVTEARGRGMQSLWLETGSTEDFTPALRLYEGAGFVRCGPFDSYVEDPFSIFMTMRLTGDGARTPLGTAADAAGPHIFYAADARDVETSRALFREYADSLPFDLAFQEFSKELAELPGKYAPPLGCILLATIAEDPAGCVALRPLGDGACEMKRLYVRPQHRGLGVGRVLGERIIADAKSRGYARIRLDTVASEMKAAVALYRALGFSAIPPYCENPHPEALFMERALREPS